MKLRNIFLEKLEIKSLSKFEKNFVIFIALTLILFFGFIVKNVGSIHLEKKYTDTLNKSEKRTISVEEIEPWMTFDYLNFVFMLPDGYLQEALQIQDEKFSRSPIGRYARINNISKQEFISIVSSKIKAYRGE